MRDPLSFGLGLPNGFPVGEPNLDFVAFAERAEALGYDRLWAGDHVVFHVPRYEIFTTLATIAARTRQISIGPGVLLLCLRNPVHVAQAIATLDRLSGGRFVLGVGVGGEHPKEFEASGVAVRERGARTDEALVLLKKLWNEPSVDHDGRFWKLHGVSMTLSPGRPPRVWVGGRARAALRRVVVHGDAWFPGFVTPERYRQGLATIEELCGRAGRDPSTIERGIFLFVGIDRDPSRARRQAEEFLSRNYAMPFTPFAPYVVTGAPEECVDGVRRYVDAGATHITVRFATADPLRQLELWSEEVLPALREV
ncbi:MAG: LLM class flavin-dependent oxidoreductase [Candidatus Binatia bacterium]